jgi:hypothetical protein
MLYVLVLNGPSVQKASLVVATRDPQIARLITDAIVAQLHPSPISLIKRGRAFRIGNITGEIHSLRPARFGEARRSCAISR